MSTYTDLDGLGSSNISFGCDLTGSSTCQTVVGLQGNPINNAAPTTGYFLKWDGSQWIPAAAPSGSFSAGGDLSGTETNQTVIRIQTYNVASTAPTDQQVLLWNGGASRWEPTTLTFTGDITGTYPSPTVVKLRGKDLDADLATIGADQDGYKLTWVNSSSEWQAIPGGSAIIWANDLLGSTDDNQYVTRISGDLDAPDYIVTLGRSGNTQFQLIGDQVGVSGLGEGLTGFPITIIGSIGGNGTTGVGGIGGAFSIKGGTGGDGSTSVTTKEGGVGGDLTIAGGTGGDGAASAQGGWGGDLILLGGTAGTGGIGGAKQGNVSIQGENVDISATVTLTLGGFGIIISGSTQMSSLGTGVVHSDSSGNISSSLIVNADVDSSAAIVVSKLAAGTANQVLINNATPTPTWTTLSGDVTNVLGVMTVGKINGASVPVAGALTTGNVLQVSGVSALSYGPVNLAGGSNYVTGTLPVGNLPTLAGDVTGSITSNTVEKINSTSVPDGPNANEVLVAISDSAAIWSQIYDGYIASNANIAVSKLAAGTAGQLLLNNATPTPTWTTMSGDATISNSGVVNVAKINGTTITTAGGSLATGAVLRVTGAATADWGQVDLADTDAVTGVLPTGNQASQTMAGDVTGTTAASTVVKLRGTSLATSIASVGSAQDGYVLTWVNGSTEWQAKPASGSGITTVGTIDTSPNANGLFISGTTISTQLASASQPGMVSTGTQTMAGAKTWSGAAVFSSTVSTGALTAGTTTTNNTLTGGLILTTRSLAADLTIDTTTKDMIILVSTAAARNITLPAPANGRTFIIKDSTGQAETNNITLIRNGSEQIEGVAASRVLSTNWGVWTITSDGTNWFFI